MSATTTRVKPVYDVLICGGGFAGISAAYFLSKNPKSKQLKIGIIDPRPPLSFTSSMSTECYRNYWGKPEVFSFVSRSIDLIEELAKESQNRFVMNRRGYVYMSTKDESIESLHSIAKDISSNSKNLSSGFEPIREFKGSSEDLARQGYQLSSNYSIQGDNIRGFDFLMGKEAVKAVFPFLSDEVSGILHARRCGWLSAQQLGMYLLEQSKENNVDYISSKVIDINQTNGNISSILVQDKKGFLLFSSFSFIFFYLFSFIYFLFLNFVSLFLYFFIFLLFHFDL